MSQITKNYRKAFVEVDAVLSCLNIEEFNKIPNSLISTIKENKDENYLYEYDINLEYDKWKLMLETKSILYNILKKYLANEEQKKFLLEKEKYQISKLEQEKRNKYNPNNIFKNNNETVYKNNAEERAIAEYKEDFFTKFKNFVIKLLHFRH